MVYKATMVDWKAFELRTTTPQRRFDLDCG